MREIPLTKGYVALVDDADFDALIIYKWNVGRMKAKDGREVIYARRTTPRPLQNMVYMHRQILGLDKQRIRVDHRDTDGLNNQRYNLRVATPTQNLGNSRKRLKPTSSKYKGVSWNKRDRGWDVRLSANKKQVCLGIFADEVEAARAYDAKARELFGEFALLNFPHLGC